MSKKKRKRKFKVTFDVVEHYSEEITVEAASAEEAAEQAREFGTVEKINPRYHNELVSVEEIA